MIPRNDLSGFPRNYESNFSVAVFGSELIGISKYFYPRIESGLGFVTKCACMNIFESLYIFKMWH